jgi:hypothetical protein
LIEKTEDSQVVSEEEKRDLPPGVVVTERQTNLQYFWKGIRNVLVKLGFCLLLFFFFLFLWLFFDVWVFASMIIAFPVVWFLFPYIAKFFMSYVYALNLDIEKQKITLCGIPYNRFEKAVVVNALGRMTTVNAPFVGNNGFLYAFDRIDFLEDHRPVVMKNPDGTVTTVSLVCDVFECNPYHSNLQYLDGHKIEFLLQRRELLAAMEENAMLRFSSHVKARRKYLEREKLIGEYADKYVFDFPELCAKKEPAGISVVFSDINDLKKQLGLNALQNTLMKNNSVVEGVDDNAPVD